MIGRRALLAFAGSAIVASLAAVAVPAGAAEWVQKKVGVYWTAWVPNDHWQVTGTRNAIDVTSPTGDEGVSRGWVGQNPGSSTPSQVVARMRRVTLASGDTSFRNMQIVPDGPAVPSANGQRQSFSVTATHQWINGTEPVRGAWYVETIETPATGYGFVFWSLYAPTAKYKSDFATLDYIRRNILMYNSPAQ